MTDKELLELAAKAAGIEYDAPTSKPHKVSGAWFGLWLVIHEEPYQSQRRYWNPLTDDGDALRLAVKLNLTIGHDEVLRMCWIRQCGTFTGKYEAGEMWGTDNNAATRRAIVRAAAAEVGKAMP